LWVNLGNYQGHFRVSWSPAQER